MIKPIGEAEVLRSYLHPFIIAKSSERVNRAYEAILEAINKVQDPILRDKLMEAIENPAPLFMEQYQVKGRQEGVYKILLEHKWIDAAVIGPDQLFPPCVHPGIMMQPFFSAPGSSYFSHHAYPGGLAVHVAENLHTVFTTTKRIEETLSYCLEDDLLIAAQVLHDIHKPWVFQWNKEGSCRGEFCIAGVGAHHILSLAESMYRNFPADVIIAQACAHLHPASPDTEAVIAKWLSAAALIAGREPEEYGISGDGRRIGPEFKPQEWYITYLADAGWILAEPAAQEVIRYLKTYARDVYGLQEGDLVSAPFFQFRNYIAAQLDFLPMHHLLQIGAQEELNKKIEAVILK